MKILTIAAVAFVSSGISNLKQHDAITDAIRDRAPSSLERFLAPVGPAQDTDHMVDRAHLDDSGHGESTSEATPTSKMLITTAYWNIQSKRGNREKSDGVYRQCMTDVMTLNSPMMIYGDASALKEMQGARELRSPSLVGSVELSLKDLAPCSARWQDLHDSEAKYTNDVDVPTVDLGCIWDGKVGLLERSARSNPDYLWHAWFDVCMGHGDVPFPHDNSPWPGLERLQKLPKDKITVSYSGQNECEQCRQGWNYCHCLAGTVFVVPTAMVQHAAANFSRKVNECLDNFATSESIGGYVCLSDQVIFTKLYLESPQLFFVSSSGYGAVATSFFASSDSAAAPDLS